MSCKNGLLRGNKFTMRHTTIIEPALGFVRFLKNSDLVRKISIGIIKPTSSSPARKHGGCRIKAQVLQTAVRMQFRGGNSVQEFHVFGADLLGIAGLAAEYDD